MSDYRHRPDDHLVEPLFGGLQGSEGHQGPQARRGWAPLALLLGALAIAAAIAFVR